MATDIVPGTFRLIKVDTKRLHPMTISDKFVTIVAFHHAEMERFALKGKEKGKSVKFMERVPVIIVWDGNEISYFNAMAGEKIKIDGQEYIIDRSVDDIYEFLPKEELVSKIVEPDFKKVIKKFNPDDLFDEVLDFFEYYFFMESKMLHKIISLFALNQCVFDAYDSTPYLLIRSPMESCGKSNLGKAIQQMWNGIISTNIDAHHIFRLVHGCSPTFILDENQDLDQRRKTDDRIKNLMSVINAGYQRGVPVIRFREKSGQFGNMVAEKFYPYGPKVIITTKGKIPRDTRSRCVEIIMQRAPRGSEYPDYSARWDEDNPKTDRPYRIEKLEKIREMAVIFRLKYGSEIKKISGKSNWRDELDHTASFVGLRNRDLEIFKPLIILCLKYKPEWTELVAKYIREFVEMRVKVEYSPETTVLYALRKMWQMVEENNGVLNFEDGGRIIFEDTEADGQVMWTTAKMIRYVIEQYGVGNIEEFGTKYVESKIGRILSEFGFLGTKRAYGGNLRMIRTSRLAEKCITYLGTRLSGNEDLSQQERMDTLAKKLRNVGEIDFEELFGFFNAKMTEDQLITDLKHLRTNGMIATGSKDGKGKVTWMGD